MKNLYTIFKIPYEANLLDIAKAYQTNCLNNPSLIFYYTKIFKILVCPPYKLIYDSMLFHTDIHNLYYLDSSLTEDEEYELGFIINWIEDFRDLVYDAKFLVNNSNHLAVLETWYDQIESILFDLRGAIRSFYLN